VHIYLLSQDARLPGYEQYDAFVIVASSEEEARRLANGRAADEGKIWDDLSIVSCVRLGCASETAPQGIVLGSYNAG